MTDEHITKIINDYKAHPGLITDEKAKEELGSYLYFHLHRFRIDCSCEDAKSDYVTWLYPRLEGIIRRFMPERAAFLTYLTWIVRSTWKSFIRQRYSKAAHERILEVEEETRLLNPDIEEFIESQSITNTTACEFKPGYQKTSTSIRNKTLILLACKAGNYIGEEEITKVCGITGYPEEEMRGKIARIREIFSKKMQQTRISQEKKNAFYIRAQRCLYEMKYLDKETGRYARLSKEYAYCVKRMETLSSTISRSLRSPSNRLLSTLLNFPRGTIDSTLAMAHRRWYPKSS